MKTGLVSVCMITFRHERFIAQAIEGVLAQKADFNIELIISDDCSDDKTRQVVEQYSGTDTHGVSIRYTKHQINKGVLGNLVWTIDQCGGDYIALCEGDDFWTDPLKLQKQVDFLNGHPEFVMSFHDRYLVDENGNRVNDETGRGYAKKTLSGTDMITGKYPPTLTWMVRKSVFQNFLWPKVPVVNLDSYIVAIMGQYGQAYFHKDILPAAYRIHGGGVWSQQDKYNKKINVYQTFEAIKENLNPQYRRLVIPKLGRLAYDIGKELLERRSKLFYSFYYRLMKFALISPTLVNSLVKLSGHYMISLVKGNRPIGN
jgi:glycosyltransferase involved in cell wall biosynthesis